MNAHAAAVAEDRAPVVDLAAYRRRKAQAAPRRPAQAPAPSSPWMWVVWMPVVWYWR